jgi:uncharacterized SAM-binding protein YcdF (DUF218 family)
MFGTIKTAIGILVMPLPLALLLLVLAGLVVLVGRRRLGAFIAASAVLLVFLASWAPVADALLGPLERHHAPVIDLAALAGVSAVVVLGGGWEPDAPWPATQRLNDSSAQRLQEGLRLLQGLPDARLIVSGGSRSADRRPVAQGYALAAQELGVPAERIVVLDTPLDTAQEAYAVRELLETGERFVLVTSASHMARAVRHFQRAGLDPIPAPTWFKTGWESKDMLAYWVPNAEQLRKTERAVYEHLGLLALSLDHRR